MSLELLVWNERGELVERHNLVSLRVLDGAVEAIIVSEDVGE